MAKYNDVSFVDDNGVKVVICAPRKARKSERTWTVDKSRHSVWAQGVSNYVRGVRGTSGTLDK